jgi:hypothetical protein
MKFTKKEAIALAKKYNINLNIIDINFFHYGLNVEREHGSLFKLPIVNITNDDPDMTVKIVIAHIFEDPHYYQRLKKMENDAEKYWSSRKKPNIFIE